MERIKYITNKDLLVEIHRSKQTYCWFLGTEYRNYDAIITSLDHLTPAFVEQTLDRKHELIAKKGPAAWPAAFSEGPITEDGLVFRLMTDEHLPLDDGKRRKRNASSPSAGNTVRCCFPPFKHFVLREGVPLEVGRSHWRGDLETGAFCADHGKINNRLAMMFMLLVERYSRRGNWRGYSYVDEMRSHALMQLSQIGLQFDESKSDNPFAFFTQVIKNCFTRVLNVERKNQHIRDDLLIMSGAAPSHTRQTAHEIEQRAEQSSEALTETATQHPTTKKRGRKPKTTTPNDAIR